MRLGLFLALARRRMNARNYFTTINSPWAALGGNRYEIDGSQVANTNLATEAGEVTNGGDYECTVEVVRCDAGWVRWVLGSTGTGTQRSTTGTFVETITATGGTFVYLQANPFFDGEVRVTSRPVVEATVTALLDHGGNDLTDESGNALTDEAA